MSAITNSDSHNSVTITVLVDNQADEALMVEHGLSLWIEACGMRILFDTGQGRALLGNARMLDIPLAQTDIIVISHGHYDHTDGLADVLALAPKARLVIHPEALVPRYSIRSSKLARVVGVSETTRKAIERLPADRVTWSPCPTMMAPDVAVTGAIPRRNSFEDTGGPFFLDQDGRQPDPIVDDQALWINTPDGAIVCLGCSHGGVVNTLGFVQDVGETSRIRAAIGGFHLVNADESRLERTMAALGSISPQTLVPCHCTGPQACARMKDTLGRRVLACRSGLKLRFPCE